MYFMSQPSTEVRFIFYFLERLISLKLISFIDLESINNDQFDPLLSKLEELLKTNEQNDINYCEWQKVPNPIPTKTGKKANKISHKVPFVPLIHLWP